MTSVPSTTTSPRNRKLAAAILAFFALNFAFVTVGSAEVSDTDTSASPTATAASGAPAAPKPAVASAPILDGATDATEESATDADAQVVWELYIHPFWDDLCFWACWEIVCPCRWIIWP